jgi:hypothetical protein
MERLKPKVPRTCINDPKIVRRIHGFPSLHRVHDFTFLPVDGLACIRVRPDELMAFCNLALIAYRVFDPRLGTGLSMTSYNAPCLHCPVAKQII